MASNRSDQEWTEIISKAQTAVTSILNDAKRTTTAKLDGPVSKYIDHTLLKLDATASQIDGLCAEAKTERFATVCVRRDFVARAKANLRGTDVGIACVVGFHEGTQSAESKVAEAEEAIRDGASELDAVLNRDVLKAGRYGEVYGELVALREVARRPVLVKVILETSQLSVDEVVAASVLAGYAGLDFIKTSTGFCGRGASLEDVRLMSAVARYLEEQGVGPRNGEGMVVRMRVKAAGGVRGIGDAVRMVEAGATRIGTSSGMKIVEGEGEEKDGERKIGETSMANGEGGY